MRLNNREQQKEGLRKGEQLSEGFTRILLGKSPKCDAEKAVEKRASFDNL